MRNKKTVTDQEIIGYDNVPVDVAASYIDIGAQALRLSLQDGNCPFGFISSKSRKRLFAANVSAITSALGYWSLTSRAHCSACA